jgi:hypothetical protein
VTPTMTPLHPNLARIAARYDEIATEVISGRISAVEGRRRIEALVAKDDNGVEWSIDVETGTWQYRALDGRSVPADPPMWGMASATPRDFGSQGPVDVDRRVEFHEVDEDRRIGLAGATRRVQRTAPGGRGLWRRVTLIVVTVAVVALIVIAVW